MKQNNTHDKRHTSLATRLILLILLVIGGGNFAWGQKSLPYSYGFENNNLAGEGWTMDVGGSTGIYNNSSYSHESSYSFKFYGTTDTQYLFSPEIANSNTGIDVSFFYNSFTQYSSRTFNVGYSTTNTEVSSFTWLPSDITYTADGWRQFNESFPTGTKYIAIRHTAISQYQPFYIDDFAVSVSTAYKTPTSFTLSSFTANSATFSWIAGNSETAWQFAYDTNNDFIQGTDGTTINITTTDLDDGKYTLNNLTQGMTYYASIRANYGSGNYSEWTDKVSFTPNNEVELSLYNGSTASYNIPITSNNVANTTALTKTQFIIPSTDLTDIQNRQITKLTFYSSRSSVTWGAATFEVYMKETNNTSYNTSTKEFESWGTCVYNNQELTTNSNGEMIITLNTPFNYTTGNLMIGIKQLTIGTAPSPTYWNSTQPYTNNAIYSYGTYTGVVSYSPKVDFLTVASTTAPIRIGANGYTTFASPYPLDLTTANLPSGLKAYKAAVENSTVRFTEIDQTVKAYTGILLEGTAGLTYKIPVVASGTAPEGNEFLVNSTGGTFSAGEYTYYAMKKATSASDELTFGTFDPSSVAIPNDKAYLKVASSDAAHELICIFDDDITTGINDAKTVRAIEFSTYYNLNGQRVAQPSKGIYIVNGKKTVVK